MYSPPPYPAGSPHSPYPTQHSMRSIPSVDPSALLSSPYSPHSPYSASPSPRYSKYQGSHGSIRHGVNVLHDIRRFAIQRRYNKDNITNTKGCTFCEGRDEYAVYDMMTGETLLAVHEESECLTRTLCAPFHDHILRISDPHSGDVVATLSRPFNLGCCFSCMDSCIDRAFLYPGADQSEVPIGVIQQPRCGGCTPEFEVISGGTLRYNVEGPACCIGGCCVQGFGMRNVGGKSIGRIRKVAAEGAVEEVGGKGSVCTVQMRKMRAAPEDILLLLTTALLVDCIYMDDGPISCQGAGLSLSFGTCHWAGFVLPCRLSLSGDR